MRYPTDDEPTEELDLPPSPEEEEPPARKRDVRTWVIVGVVLVVVLGAAFVIYQLLSKDPASKAQPGECIKVNSATDQKADVETIDCADQIAVLKVGKRLGNDTDECPTGAYSKYTQTGRGEDFALCLMLNARDGDCFDHYAEPARTARVDCASAEIKVDKVLAGKADETACIAPTVALVYPEPPTTLCVRNP